MTSLLKQFSQRMLLEVVVVATLLCGTSLACAQENDAPQRVVILSGANFLMQASVIQEQAMRQALVAGSPRRLELYAEAIETMWLPSADYETEYVAFLKKKYAATKVDLVVTITAYALDFAERHRDAIWPGSPVVFYSVSEELVRNRTLKPGFTGQAVSVDVGGTLDLAIRLQPEARRVIVFGGVGDADQYWVARAGEHLRRYEGKMDVLYFTNRPATQMIADLRQFGRDTIVLFTTINRDSTGEISNRGEPFNRAVEASGAPVYSLFSHRIGQGMVGGSVSSLEDQGQSAARLALRVLAGENPDAIPVQPPLPNVPTVDWRQLRRWGISESRLPPGTVIKFREPSFWQLYRGRIAITFGVIASQTALIIGLLVQRRRRHQAEMQVQRERMELAHAARLATAGELTASIAHELNQPLGAILRNAEAAEMMLQTASPDIEELRVILADIRADDRRAGDVIDRLRALLKRRVFEPQALDVMELVTDVTALVRPDAAVRRVHLETDVLRELPRVHGDRVHLQQVLLNLIINGMDALNNKPGQRRVAIRARTNGKRMIEVSVSDTGHGIPAEKMGRVFEPFFTTKAKGMGLGLSVSRSLVEANGGRIWAEKNPEGGATFCFTLKIAEPGGKT